MKIKKTKNNILQIAFENDDYDILNLNSNDNLSFEYIYIYDNTMLIKIFQKNVEIKISVNNVKQCLKEISSIIMQDNENYKIKDIK